MLATTLIKEIRPHCITVAEDVSGMPTLCRTVGDGGMGFDYRLSMFMPDMWIKLLKETSDEHWNMGHITHSLTNRRWREKVVGYAESHDQAIVGDKTISMWLFDAEIYTGMSKICGEMTLRISRGMALHKMIRLISQTLGGESYLNFMGNEFGHPEWIDFPREGNGNSYDHCRRQWNLMYDHDLRYHDLAAFDQVMNAMEIKFGNMIKPHQYVSLSHEGDKLIVFEKGDCLFIFNFHPDQSLNNYKVGTHWGSDHFVLFESDEKRFGGHERLNDAHGRWYEAFHEGKDERPYSLDLYIPSRTCIVLCPYENAIGKDIPEMPAVTERQRNQVKNQPLSTQPQPSTPTTQPSTI